jgi:hypothetical protein
VNGVTDPRACRLNAAERNRLQKNLLDWALSSLLSNDEKTAPKKWPEIRNHQPRLRVVA